MEGCVCTVFPNVEDFAYSRLVPLKFFPSIDLVATFNGWVEDCIVPYKRGGKEKGELFGVSPQIDWLMNSFIFERRALAYRSDLICLPRNKGGSRFSQRSVA